MTIHFVIIIIIVILAVLGLIVATTYNKFQDYIIKINEVEGKIDESLREKFDIILNLNNVIKEKIKTQKSLVDDISKLKEKDISSFDMDRALNEAMNKINFVKEKYEIVDGDEDIMKNIYDIEDIDESIRACKKYYNETITKYNILIRKFPYNLIGKILKYDEKTFFDGKNMNDKNIKDFKL